MRLDPWPSAEEAVRYYPKSYWFAPDKAAADQLEDAYRRLVLRDHIGFVSQSLQGVSGALLDVGCGGALLGRLLREKGVPVIGFDSSQQAAAVGWRHNGVPVACGDLNSAPFRLASFGAVSMFHVVEHLPDPEGFLLVARDLLQPGGRLIVQVPNAACWQFAILGRRWNGLDVPRHLVDYRARDLDKLIERCGFEVIRHKYFSLRDNPAGLASSIAPGLDPMARRVRKLEESSGGRLLRDLIYFGLVVASVPFAVAEAAFGAGSTVMVEARKRA
jgi:SAM-dependent methyltransferase